MEHKSKRTSFDWTSTEEPHSRRRKLILEKYPQIKELYGHNPNMKWNVIFLVFLQITILEFLKTANWTAIILASYFIGAVISNSLSIAIHDLSHNFAFLRPNHNKLFGVFANLPLVFPYSLTYRKYHWDHHLFLGHEIKDIDLTTELEGTHFNTPVRKFIWLCLQPLINSYRMSVNPKPTSYHEILSAIIQFIFDICIWYHFGSRMIVYLSLSFYFGISIHPIAASLISSHLVIRKGYETYSYYGLLNLLTFNIGYHNEHHDFPHIAACNLPKVREIATEFYDDLPYHTSWMKLYWDFIMNPELGPYARTKRKDLKTK